MTPDAITHHAPPAPDDPATVVACGVLAATLAALCHETLGHGVACYAEGGRLTVLTSIWFRCQGATSLTYVAGPVASLVGGLVGVVLLRRSTTGATRLLLCLFAAFSLFWFAGQLVSHAVTRTDVWAMIAARRHWPPSWRPVAIVLGVAGYIAALRLIGRTLRAGAPLRRRAILIGYLAGAVSAAGAGLLWAAMPVRSAVEGILTLGVAPLGLVVIAGMAGRGAAVSDARPGSQPGSQIARSGLLIAIGLVVYVVFILVQGRGLGPLAGSALRL